MKRITAFFLAVLVIVNLLVSPTLAVGNNEIQPRFTYISYIASKLVIDDQHEIATCTGILETYSDYELKLICRLQRLNAGTWTTVSSWTVNVDNKRLLKVTESISINTEYQYRVSVLACVYDGNTLLESASKFSS